MIGQTMINVRPGGARTRLSAGVFLMVLCLVLEPVVSDIAMAANLAIGVVAGSITAMVVFARLVDVTAVADSDGRH
ncbi:hypothetical protein [Amycolatopsis sp. ATCC 39116]|uniref:hypothetical protein n=1 Tax=Amycolatopsis sp. (strain ATCC 39116 / 75iv2) TaxID=385957 RepID=UPI00026270E2